MSCGNETAVQIVESKQQVLFLELSNTVGRIDAESMLANVVFAGAVYAPCAFILNIGSHFIAKLEKDGQWYDYEDKVRETVPIRSPLLRRNGCAENPDHFMLGCYVRRR